MINLTSQYPGQTFLAPASAQIQAQINAINSTGVINKRFPKEYRRTSFAGVAPDGSEALMYQYDAMVNVNAQYAYQSIGLAQNQVLQDAAQGGNEYYIEISPLPVGYYSILAWASNL